MSNARLPHRFARTLLLFGSLSVFSAVAKSEDLTVFDIHFVVLTPDGPSETTTLTDADTGAAYTGEDIFWREVEILNERFRDASGNPVCDGGGCVRFRYHSHTWYEDLADNPCGVLAFGEPTAYVHEVCDVETHACYDEFDHPSWADDFQMAMGSCTDQRVRVPFAINFYVYDNPTSNNSHGRSFTTDSVRMGHLVLDAARLLHHTQAPEEHEMGHVFGLPHVSDSSVRSTSDSSNIMCSSDCDADIDGDSKDDYLSGGLRDQGFTTVTSICGSTTTIVDQVDQIMTSAHEFQDNWRANGWNPTRIYYVNSANKGPGDGLSWATAWPSLQSALDEASTTGDTVQICVAQGEYVPTTRKTAADPYSVTFQLGANVKLYGGFNGTERTIDERDPARYVTTLNGKSCYHVVTTEATGLNTVLSGFTVTGGNAASGMEAYSAYGGGMLIVGASPIVRECVFKGNLAHQSGGAMLINGSSPLILQCLFLGNGSNVYGGAVYNYGQGEPYLASCAFSGNVSGSGGGLASSQGTMHVINCTFSQNTASKDGGGIFGRGAGTALSIDNNILWGNTAGDATSKREAQLRVIDGATRTVRYSCLQGWNLGGVGNSNADPKLQNAVGADGAPGTDDDNLRLSGSSPSVDAGSNDLLPWWLAAGDLDGHPRICNEVIDRGAYENKNFVIAK